MTREKSRGARRGGGNGAGRQVLAGGPRAVRDSESVATHVGSSWCGGAGTFRAACGGGDPGQERSAVLVRVECSVRPWDAVDISMR
jgi:hypothetical protein